MTIALLGAALLLAAGCGEPAAEPRGAAPTLRVERPAFDGDTAYALLLRQVDFGPRVPGSEGHRAQLAWMTEHLRAHADTVLEQRFTHTTAAGETLRLTNLLARFWPEQPDRVLLLAHWDTRPRADQSRDPAERELPVPGANDGASGTAVLLHLAELFRRQPPPIGVDILLVDGEDFGPDNADMFIGSRFFAANLEPGYRPLYGVLLDMVGDADPLFPVEGYSAQMAPGVVQRVWGVARDLGYADVFPNTPGGYVEDDHVPLNRAGIPTIDIIDFDYGPGNSYWHTPRDLPENTSAETLRIVGEVVAELVYRGG